MWFCLGLIFDYGFFKVTSFDWALDGSWWLRATVLGLVVVGYFAYLFFRVFRRLTKEFSYPALALVLERRYPKLLGDRLITAVELADVDAMAKYGYSKEMIRATIAEARGRVRGPRSTRSSTGRGSGNSGSRAWCLSSARLASPTPFTA